MTLPRAVAAIRLAVRRSVADVEAGPVLVACSGGADSLALLSATVFEARRAPWRVVGVTVDHGLQDDSADRAATVVDQMARIGVDETVSVRVAVRAAGLGPEAAAREARYDVLEEVAERFGSSVVLLGHTLDDQAETVLLGLTRGSGGRSITGMRPAFGPFRRPLLGVRRTQTEAACEAEALEFWRDPHNEDPRFTRARVRHRVLPLLEEELGPGVTEALARTGEMLREDVAALDELAEAARAELAEPGEPGAWRVDRLRPLAPAVRRRLLRAEAVAAGAPAAELFRVHVLALDELVQGGSGRQVQLPGHVTGYRDGGWLRLVRAAGRGDGPAVAG